MLLLEIEIFKLFLMIRSRVLGSYSACRKNLILFNSSALISGGICALPKGVISETNSSTVICSNPFILIMSLQNSFSSSRQPEEQRRDNENSNGIRHSTQVSYSAKMIGSKYCIWFGGDIHRKVI